MSSRTGILLATAFALGTVTLAGACASPEQAPSQVASLATSGASATTTAQSSSAAKTGDDARPRHRVDETKEESKRLIEPWTACMKDHGADPDQQPHNIPGAKQWSTEHKDAGAACLSKLPLLPWGLDRANPAYHDNVHRWVQCMASRGMTVVETPDDTESPWHYGNGSLPPDSAKIEHDCEVQTLGPSDK